MEHLRLNRASTSPAPRLREHHGKGGAENRRGWGQERVLWKSLQLWWLAQDWAHHHFIVHGKGFMRPHLLLRAWVLREGTFRSEEQLMSRQVIYLTFCGQVSQWIWSWSIWLDCLSSKSQGFYRLCHSSAKIIATVHCASYCKYYPKHSTHSDIPSVPGFISTALVHLQF